MFDKYELEIIERALGRTVRSLQASKYIGDSDPYLAKCEVLHAKAKSAAKDAPK